MATAERKQEVATRPQGQVVSADAATIMDVIRAAASDPNMDVDKLERLTALYERLTARQAEQAFNLAMKLAQTEMRAVAADAQNPSTHSKYASYAALDRVVRPIYVKHGFALTFNTDPGAADNYVRVVCDVLHDAGHTKRFQIDMPADGKGAKGGDVMTKTHAVGSAMSYGSRYLLKSVFNIAVGDDDGNAASSAAISAEQLADLGKLISDLEALPEKVVAHAAKLSKSEIKTLAEIPAKHYDKVVAALNDWGKKQRGIK